MSRTALLATSGALLVSALLVEVVSAQRNPAAVNAALQARARMGQSHAQSGYVSQGYRPYSMWSYNTAARAHTQSLYAYGKNCQTVNPMTVREQVTEVRRNVAQATRELAKFDDAAALEADVKEILDALREHYARCEKHCRELEAAVGKEQVASMELCLCCHDVDKELRAAAERLRQLNEALGITPPDATPASPEPAPTPAPTPQK
jgi:cytochrome c556